MLSEGVHMGGYPLEWLTESAVTISKIKNSLRVTEKYREVQRVTEKYSYYEATYKIYRRDLYGKTSKRRVNYKANTMYI